MPVYWRCSASVLPAVLTTRRSTPFVAAEHGAGQKQYECSDDSGGRAAEPETRYDHWSHPFLEG